MRIVTLLARHGTRKYPAALEALTELFVRTLPGVEHEIVVVDNALPAGHEQRLATQAVLIGGDNRAWEFTAWECGLAWLGSRLGTFDFVHLATSAFQALPAPYLERFNPAMLAAVAGRAVAVGHIDCYDEPVAVFGRRSRHWLRSSCLFLSPAGLERLGRLATLGAGRGGAEKEAAEAELFSGDPAAPFRPEAPVSARYRRYILDWLTGPGTGQGTLWHSRFTLAADTLPFFEAKATAILNEHLLSLRLGEQGCTLVDAIWLDSRVRAGLPVAFLPSWQRQLAGRDICAIRVRGPLGRCLVRWYRRLIPMR